jgi:ABC-type dipeptide/oligopeptide/nickel transport system, ATPase component
VLIADEPTTALDVTIQAQILDLVKDLRRRLGMAVVWITHDLGVVAGIADRVMVMYGGQVVETAEVDDLYADPAHPYTQALLRTAALRTGPSGRRRSRRSTASRRSCRPRRPPAPSRRAARRRMTAAAPPIRH